MCVYMYLCVCVCLCVHVSTRLDVEDVATSERKREKKREREYRRSTLTRSLPPTTSPCSPPCPPPPPPHTLSAMMKSELGHLRKGLTNASEQISQSKKQGEDWDPFLRAPLEAIEVRVRAVEEEAKTLDETYKQLCQFYAYMGDDTGEMGSEKFFLMMNTFLTMVREAQKKLSEDIAKEAKRARVLRAKERAKASKGGRKKRGGR